jgi:hypothetical protein
MKSRVAAKQPRHRRILRSVEQLVYVIRIESSVKADLGGVRDARKGRRSAVSKSPLAVRDELSRVVLMNPPGQGCFGVVGADRLVSRRLGHILSSRWGAENVFSPHPPPDLAAVAVLGDR